VIEELALYDKTLEMGRAADHVLTTEKWGPNFFFDCNSDTEEIKLNYFVSEVSKVARYALPFIKNIKLMLDL